MSLEVIGAGFGRTGTESMKLALEKLGFGPCYHMREVISRDRIDLWCDAASGRLPNWDEAFAGYRATVDWPAARFWREIAMHYQQAKVLLTVRSAESWYASMQKTILRVLREKPDPNPVAIPLIRDGVFKGNITDKDHMIAAYERNTAEVQAAFGADRLLTYELGEGWTRLCDFLGCDVPDEPFPRSNEADDFMETNARLDSLRRGGEPA
ncbi:MULTISPECIES: sulfotransferase family protein [Tropicimonas]|uniref:Sulfotransferase family protein n=2 Tax=Tropicimonas TaxID=599652 RepID=A0A239KS06_9RHOB|nr:sulfotransferase family protein [Tropicimonas sediminicola]SNT20309.1 hypothetical protein SAMN05421757_107283 [Tropicimonas sediminicola]